MPVCEVMLSCGCKSSLEEWRCGRGVLIARLCVSVELDNCSASSEVSSALCFKEITVADMLFVSKALHFVFGMEEGRSWQSEVQLAPA
jgi:hypothetical protein